jgi:hypothetical protein
MAGKTTDKWAQLAALHVTQTVANTDVYVNFNFPFSIQDKVALLIHRIEYQPGSLNQLNTAEDAIEAGISCAKVLDDPMDITDPMLIDYHVVLRHDLGAAASGILRDATFIKDFSNLPGGGILTPPNPLYAFVHTVAAAAVMACRIRMYYTYFALADAEYWQLVESRRIVSG